ncbi:MAG: hypothetical protein E6I52_28930, partial [Chloroflexi bacterium]
MERIRWGNVVLAALALLAVGFASLIIVGIDPSPKLSEAVGAIVSQVHPLPVRAKLDSVPPVPVPTLAPLPMLDDGGFQSEVAVPQSTGQFPLGTITVA